MNDLDISSLKQELQDIMWNNVGILRYEKGLLEALEKVCLLSKKFPRSVKCLNKEEYEFKNMLVVAKLIIRSALQRKESRGAHYRSDFQNTLEDCNHSIITKEEGDLCFVK